MSATPRHIPDHECKQGKCGQTSTGCWGECSLKRYPVHFVGPDTLVAPAESGCRMSGGICACHSGGSYGGCVRERENCCAATLPAAPAPTEQAGELPLLPTKGELWEEIRDAIYTAEDLMRDLPPVGAKRRHVEAYQNVDKMIDRIYVALDARQAPDSRDAWPEEPTPEMQAAGAQAIRFDTTIINKMWTANAVYRAMRAAQEKAQ